MPLASMWLSLNVFRMVDISLLLNILL